MRPAVPARLLLLVAACVAASASAAGNPGVLTVGKRAVLRPSAGFVRVGRDPLLAGVAPCGGDVVPHLILASYPQSTMRVVTHLSVDLPCSGWSRRRGAWRYDGHAPGDGVRSVTVGPAGLLVRFGDDGYAAPAGPVGYVEVWLEVGGARLNARFHNLARNTARLVVARAPSRAGAAGEAAFWTVLHGEDDSEAQQQRALASLSKAVRRDRRDGRSRFLRAMLHLYRFGQRVGGWDAVPPDAEPELAAAVEDFTAATPLLWHADTNSGDSRVPGFAAAARWGLGRIRGDAALQAEGFADLEAAVAVNPFFNVFDLIPVTQAVAWNDPLYATAMAKITPYVLDPETFACVGTQPEICADRGLAPHNVAGALMLFGDVFAKNGQADQAAFFYGIAVVGADPAYRFRDAALLRAQPGAAAARAAAYRDADPTNDPLIIGARAENCAVCHTK